MARVSVVCIALFLLAAVCSANINVDGTGKRLLVLLDNLGLRESHSFYFKKLAGEDSSRPVSHSMGVAHLAVADTVMREKMWARPHFA